MQPASRSVMVTYMIRSSGWMPSNCAAAKMPDSASPADSMRWQQQGSRRLLAPGSSEPPRLPIGCRRWLSCDSAAFVPGYSGGPATDWHRVPFHRTERGADYS